MAAQSDAQPPQSASPSSAVRAPTLHLPTDSSLAQTQAVLSRYILAPMPSHDTGPSSTANSLVKERTGVDAARRLGIYHHAYRARLNEVLVDTFSKTSQFMGSTLFDEEAIAFAVAHPPTARSLNRYGQDFPDHLASRYPENPELFELARLDWDLRQCFDGPDAPSFGTNDAQADTAGDWLSRPAPLHPSLRLRAIQTNVVQVWRAIDADSEVPPIEALEEPASLVVWRKGLQPHFQSVEAAQALFLQHLANGASITACCESLPQTALVLKDPQQLARWLQAWLQEAWLAAA
ncbi:MAG: DNA-binding domain-containing protein [Pseudomonadota bacterium]